MVEAVQVDVELAVREAVAHLVRPVHGQRGLADAGGAADGRDDHGVCCPQLLLGRKQCVESGEFAGTAGKTRGVVREFGGHGALARFGERRRGRSRPMQEEGAVVAQHRFVHPAQILTGIGSEFVPQSYAHVVVGAQGFRLSSAAVQGPHAQGRQ